MPRLGPFWEEGPNFPRNWGYVFSKLFYSISFNFFPVFLLSIVFLMKNWCRKVLVVKRYFGFLDVKIQIFQNFSIFSVFLFLYFFLYSRKKREVSFSNANLSLLERRRASPKRGKPNFGRRIQEKYSRDPGTGS